MDIMDIKIAVRKAKKYADTLFDAVKDGLHYKGSVASSSQLPLSSNKKGDMYTASDTGHEWVWTISSGSGQLSDWLDLSQELDGFVSTSPKVLTTAEARNVISNIKLTELIGEVLEESDLSILVDENNGTLED